MMQQIAQQQFSNVFMQSIKCQTIKHTVCYSARYSAEYFGRYRFRSDSKHTSHWWSSWWASCPASWRWNSLQVWPRPDLCWWCCPRPLPLPVPFQPCPQMFPQTQTCCSYFWCLLGDCLQCCSHRRCADWGGLSCGLASERPKQISYRNTEISFGNNGDQKTKKNTPEEEEEGKNRVIDLRLALPQVKNNRYSRARL